MQIPSDPWQVVRHLWPFNSLFEMHLLDAFVGCAAPYTFNSLFEMQLGGVGFARARGAVAFNSLFEMHSGTPTWRNAAIVALSILYLRCKSNAQGRGPATSRTFNSLFEMPRWARRLRLKTLSILYLRCCTLRCTDASTAWR